LNVTKESAPLGGVLRLLGNLTDNICRPAAPLTKEKLEEERKSNTASDHGVIW